MSDTAARDKARLTALAAIEKKFGKNVIQSADAWEPAEIGVIPSGSLGIDKITGIGGYPRGRIIEVYGPNASGKTTLTLHAVAEAQKMGLRCCFVDAEHTFDKSYSKALGVDLASLDISHPSSGEEALDTVEELTKSTAYALIVIDSVSALIPTAEIKGEMGDSHVGLQARLMGQAMRKLTVPVAKTGTTVIFLNQIRQKIGVMFGSPETTSGGNALGFYSSLRLDIRRIGSIKKGEDVIGGRARVKMVKNKCAGTAYQTCEFDLYSNNEFGAGISYIGELVDSAVPLGIIEKAGAWYSYQGEKLGQGRDNVILALKNDKEFFNVINTQVRKEFRLDPA